MRALWKGAISFGLVTIGFPISSDQTRRVEVPAPHEVDPLLFYKLYYLEAVKGGDMAYVLLRDALVESGKIAIARVVIRTLQQSIQQTQAKPKSEKAGTKTRATRRSEEGRLELVRQLDS